MSVVFILLLLLALFLLAYSIAKPTKVAKILDKNNKYNLKRKHLSLSFGIAVIVLFILAGITSPQQPKTATAKINLSSAKTTVKAPKPKITTQTVAETKSIPYPSTTVNDSNLAKGTTKVTTQGVDGVETLTYKETLTNGKQTGKQLVSDITTTQPITQVTSIGTYVAPAPAPAPSDSCTNGTYVNSEGNTVCSPEASSSVPAGATAQCADGTYSFSQSHSGTCSHHGGVAQWL